MEKKRNQSETGPRDGRGAGVLSKRSFSNFSGVVGMVHGSASSSIMARLKQNLPVAQLLGMVCTSKNSILRRKSTEFL